jgi:hypothetical protein
MDKVNDIQEELRKMGSPLADAPRTMPYSVPANYFEDFLSSVRNIISEDEVQIAGQWGKEMPYEVPAGYFEELSAKVIASAKIGHLQAEKAPFDVPEGYFESLPGKILQAAKSSSGQGARTIPFMRMKIFNAVKWAAAAVLVVGLGLGSYRAFFASSRSNPEMILSSVPGNEIHDYIQHNYRIDADKVVGSNADLNNIQLDNQDIVQYLDENGWD